MGLRSDLDRLQGLLDAGQTGAARDLLRDLVQTQSSAEDPGRSRLLRAFTAYVLLAEAEYDRAYEFVSSLFQECREANDREVIARCHLLLSAILLRRGEYACAKQHAEGAVYLYVWEFANAALRGTAYNNLGIAEKNLGIWGGAERSFREALRAYAGTPELAKTLRTSRNLAILLRKMGRVDEAERVCREGLDTAAKSAIPHAACCAALELANISVIKRDAAECARHLQAASDIARTMNYRREQVLALEIQGDMLAVSGDADGSLRAYTDGLSLAEQYGLKSDVQCELLRRLGHAHLTNGGTDEAKQSAMSGLALAEQIGDAYEHATCLRVLGEVEVAEGMHGEGLDHLRQSVKELSRLSLWSHETAVSEVALGKALMVSEDGLDVGSALEHLFAARRIYSDLGVEQAVREIDALVTPSGAPSREGVTPASRPSGRRALSSRPSGVGSYGIITSDKRIADDVTRWGQTDVRVLIEGDTGVGKELVARAMHAMSRRREERFVAVDCGALSESLAESELFGHAKGSFTGALRDRAGLIEEADGGTLFLDEVGELTEVLQAKLLRVLEEGAVRRVGENPLRAVNIRILSATTKDLWAEVEAGRFRRDLYYRLKGVVVRVPSLRERPGDVELLLDHFAGRYCEAYGRSVEIGDKARELFLEYEWPGNVRELRHVVEALVASGRDGEVIEADRAAEFLEATRSGSAPDGESSGVDREKMERALDASGGNKAEAARRLGISRKTLYRKMQRPQTE